MSSTRSDAVDDGRRDRQAGLMPAWPAHARGLDDSRRRADDPSVQVVGRPGSTPTRRLATRSPPAELGRPRRRAPLHWSSIGGGGQQRHRGTTACHRPRRGRPGRASGSQGPRALAGRGHGDHVVGHDHRCPGAPAVVGRPELAALAVPAVARVGEVQDHQAARGRVASAGRGHAPARVGDDATRDQVRPLSVEWCMIGSAHDPTSSSRPAAIHPLAVSAKASFGGRCTPIAPRPWYGGGPSGRGVQRRRRRAPGGHDDRGQHHGRHDGQRRHLQAAVATDAGRPAPDLVHGAGSSGGRSSSGWPRRRICVDGRPGGARARVATVGRSGRLEAQSWRPPPGRGPGGQVGEPAGLGPRPGWPTRCQRGCPWPRRCRPRAGRPRSAGRSPCAGDGGGRRTASPESRGRADRWSAVEPAPVQPPSRSWRAGSGGAAR